MISSVWNHPYWTALAIVVILTLLTISRLRRWIETGEFLSLVIEVLIVVMIGMELKEGADQAKIFSSLDVSAQATATTLKGLEQAQKDSAETLSQTLATIRQTNAAINNQFSLAKRQYQEGSQRPVLQVRAILWKNNEVTTQVLDPRKPIGQWMADIYLLSVGERIRMAEFLIRNVGTAEAVKVEVRPQLSPGISVPCVDYPSFKGSTPLTPLRPPSVPNVPCDVASGVDLTIPPRPKDRLEFSGQTGTVSPDFDVMYDVWVRIFVEISQIKDFSLVFTVNAEGINPTRYVVLCHNPFPNI